jgi:hypothetical protein
MSVNLTVEIHGLCALLVKGTEEVRIACVAGDHTAVMTVPTGNVILSQQPEYRADRIFVVGETQYAQWDLAGSQYSLGDKAQGPAKISDPARNIFDMQAGYREPANASAEAWDGAPGKLISTRMTLYGGMVGPVKTSLSLMTLAALANEPDYSHDVTDIVTFSASGAPDAIDLGNGKTVPLRGSPTISICNFGNMLEDTRFAHFAMYHMLLSDQSLPYRKIATPQASPGFAFPIDCVPPIVFPFMS